MDYLDILKKGASQLGVELDERQIKKLDDYLKQLRFFNNKFNLTAITEPEDIVVKHFLDSLSVIQLDYIKPGKSLLDIGTGAGFPGLVLKIVVPDLTVTLLEANKKKSLFLDHMIERLRLNKVSVVNLRAEDFGATSGRDQFDVVIARALSSLPVNLEYAMPNLKIGGFYLAMKGTLANEPSTENACKELGCQLVETKKIELPFIEAERNIVVFKKVSQTNPKYPRRSGVPTKKPL